MINVKKKTNKKNPSKTCVKPPLSKGQKIGFQDQLSLNACQKYCRMLQGEHSAIILTFIKLPFIIKIFVLSIFERPFYTGFTVQLVPIKKSFESFYQLMKFICIFFRLKVQDRLVLNRWKVIKVNSQLR